MLRQRNATEDVPYNHSAEELPLFEELHLLKNVAQCYDLAMAPSDSDSSVRSSWPRIPFQFSLKTLLIVVTVLAVVMGIGSILPSLFHNLVWPILASVLLPPLLIIAIHGHGQRQAFAAGSLLTLVLGFFASDSTLGVIIWLCLAILSGFVAMWTRLWIEKQGWSRPK